MILYLETNFLMAVATGREPDGERLFRLPSDALTICLPAVCLMEALSAFEDEQRRRNRLQQELDQQVIALGRDNTSPSAARLRAHLDAARAENGLLLEDVRQRLQAALLLVSGGAPPLRGAELLPPPPAALRGVVVAPTVPNQPTDTLLLNVVLEHAGRHPGEEKALISGNTKDFDGEPGRGLLRDAGIRFFSGTETFLAWFDHR